MAHKSTNNESATSILPYWSKVLRALRKSRGVTQDCWAAQLGYSRATIRRWESGRSVPSADAEQTIIALCEQRNLFRDIPAGPFLGCHISPDWLADILATARLDMVDQQHGLGMQSSATGHCPPQADLPISFPSDGMLTLTMESAVAQVLTTLIKESSAPDRTHVDHKSDMLLSRGFLCHEVSTVNHGMMISCDSLTYALQYVSDELSRVERLQHDPQFGIHIGEVIYYDGTIYGKSVEICNELAKLARPGTVLVSKAVAELADSGQYQFSEVPELAGSRFAIGTSVLTMKVTKGLTSGRQIAEELKE